MENISSNSLLEEFFDSDTMSVHFKENVHILRKKWKPGNWWSEKLDIVPDQNYLNNLIDKLFIEVNNRSDSFLEIEKRYSKVLQLWPYRIVIVLPPLSDGIEITIVKPIKKLTIKDYKLSDKILELLKTKANWILISWWPWQGKTTFAQALIEMFVDMDKIVKTVESPRDLLVSDEVTQYSFSHAPHSEVRDILLLSRPDYTIYDEVRNTEDFILYKDLRLTGIWLVWIIHATNPIDSIQRFIWTIQMWLIPQIIDTVIFIQWWTIGEIFTLEQVVKTPEWMESDDLARPVILIDEFETQTPKYEIYTYWEQVVVMPLGKVKEWIEKVKNKVVKYWEQYLQSYLQDYYDMPLIVESEWNNWIKIYVNEKNKWAIIGKWWERIIEVEKKLWLSISVKTMDDIKTSNDTKIDISISPKWNKDYMILTLPKEFKNQKKMFLIGDEVVELTIDDRSQIKLKKCSTSKKIEKHWINIII